MRILLVMALMLLGATPLLGAEGDANPFAGTIFQAVAAAITFLTVYFVLKAKAWGPILKGLQDRENRIKDDLEQAEAASRNARQTLAEYEQKLVGAQDEARKIIEQGKVDAQKLAASLREQTQAEITLMRQRAQDQIHAAREQALSEIYEQTAVIATQVASRILQREINPEDQRELVERSLTELNRN